MPLILLLLLSSSEVDGRGSPGELPRDVSSMRKDARLRASAGGGATFGFSDNFPTGAVSVIGELGITFIDRLSFTARLEIGTVIWHVVGSCGVRVGLALSDQFGLNLGAAFSAWRPSGSAPGDFYGFTFPLSISFAPAKRGPTDIARRGLVFALQFAPGVSLPQLYQGDPRAPIFGFLVMLSAAYAVW